MKINDYISSFKKNQNLQIIAKSLGAIALITAVASISVHYLTGDTLSDYAEKNPEKAYSSSIAVSDSPSTSNVTYAPNILISDNIHFYKSELLSEEANPPSDVTLIAPGFYYMPISSDVIDYITGYYNTSDTVLNPKEYTYVGILYIDTSGVVNAGEMICNSSIAQDLTEIFYSLYQSDYQLGSVSLPENFAPQRKAPDNADDICVGSINANNTYCFCMSPIDDAVTSSQASLHSLGLAIDINPAYNPYVVIQDDLEASSPTYSDRSQDFALKIDQNDLCYRLFTERGFTWGGDRNINKSYMHFQKKNK